MGPLCLLSVSTLHTMQLSLSLQYCLWNGSDFYTILFTDMPDFSTTFIPTPHLLTAASYRLFSSDPGVAGTKITLQFPPLLNQFILFILLSFCLSTLFHIMGLYNGCSPRSSFSMIALYALNADFTTSPLNFILYPENCILCMKVSTWDLTTVHGRSGEHHSSIRNTS